MRPFILALIFVSLVPFVAGRVFAGNLPVHGFISQDVGIKLNEDTTKKDSYNLAEQRLQLRTIHFFEEGYWAEKGGIFNFKGDFTVDEYYSGKTGFELRELNLSLRPFDFMDMKAGRQILTWGTGDYLFINDMFPKDYISFFIGREDEYLKKPSDALKISLYPEMASIDFVWIPLFEPNTTAKGDRVSFFDSFQGGIAGTNSNRHLIEPSRQLSNSEYALRVYRTIKGYEMALYFFSGFDKNPRSYKDEVARQLYYQKTDVYGASVRGTVFKGIGNMEAGYYHSRDDSSGADRMIENSFFKFLAGYSQDMGNDLRLGFQYLFEQRLDYASYKDNLLAADYVFDEYRHLLTQRLTKQFLSQTLTVSLFNFYSPSDKDGYARPSVSYDVSDQLKVTVGANIPWGEDVTTEFGQMRRNKNIYVRIKYSF